MKYNYFYFKQNLYNEHIGKYDTFGISLKNNRNIHIDDVSCNEQLIRKIVSKLNKNQVSPVHLQDVIEDMITS